MICALCTHHYEPGECDGTTTLWFGQGDGTPDVPYTRPCREILRADGTCLHWLGRIENYGNGRIYSAVTRVMRGEQ